MTEQEKTMMASRVLSKMDLDDDGFVDFAEFRYLEMSLLLYYINTNFSIYVVK
jgi:hypothetical protein